MDYQPGAIDEYEDMESGSDENQDDAEEDLNRAEGKDGMGEIREMHPRL